MYAVKYKSGKDRMVKTGWLSSTSLRLRPPASPLPSFSPILLLKRSPVVVDKEDSPPPGKQLSDPPAGPPRRQHWARSSQAIGIRSEIRDVRAKNLAVHWDSL